MASMPTYMNAGIAVLNNIVQDSACDIQGAARTAEVCAQHAASLLEGSKCLLSVLHSYVSLCAGLG
jgi:hypothetical protein